MAAFLLLLASREDLETFRCDNRVHIVLLGLGLIGLEPGILLGRALGAVLIGLLLLGLALVTKGKLGGADIKLMAAVSIGLGLKKTVMALMVGAVMALLGEGLLQKNAGRFAFIPYLTIGILGQWLI